MAFLRGTEEYYQKFIELQEKLRQSEEDRLKLEIKFNEMVQVTREEEQAYYRKLRSQYKHFLEQDRRRQERNERIIRLLERIESRAAMLAAKTERFELLRKQYQAYLRRIFENMNQQNVSDKAEASHLPKMPTIVEQRPNLYDHPAIRKVLFNDEKPNYKADIVKEYLNSLSKPTSKDEVLKATRSSSRVPAAISDFSDTNGSNLSYCDLEFPQYALSSSNIADEIVSSLSSRPPPTNTRASKVDFKKSKDHFNEDPRFCGTKLSSKYNTNPTDEVEFLARSVRDFDNQRHPQNFNEFDEYDKKYELRNLTNNENKNALRRNVTFNDNKSDSKHDGDRLSIGGALNTYVENKNIRANAEDLEYPRRKKGNPIMNKSSKQNLPKQADTFGEVLEKIKDDAFNYTRIDVNNPKFADPIRKSNIENETHDESNYGTAEHIQEQANLADETEIDRTISHVLNEEKPIIIDNVEQTKLNIGNIKYEANVNEARNNNENNEDMQQFDEHRYDESECDKQNVHKNYQPIHRDDKVEEIMPNLDDQSKFNNQDQMQHDEHGQVAEYESNGTANSGDIVHSNFDQKQYNSQEKLPEQTVTIEQDEQPNQYDQKSQEDDGHFEKPNEMDDQDHHIQYDDKDRQMQYDEQGQQPQYDESNVTYKEPLDLEGKPLQYGEDDESIHYDQNSQPIQYDEHNQAIQNDEYSQPIQIESNNYEEEPKQIDENKYQEQYDDQGQLIQQTEYDESRPPVSHVQYDENASAQSVLYDENGQPIQPIQYDENEQAMQYDEKGQAVQPIQYDENGQAIQPIQYDENGQAIQPIQYDENGQAIQPIQYDETGQPVQFDENGQPVQPIQYDENGQPITYYPQYDENGQPIQQYYENDAPNQQYDENGQLIHQYGDNGQPFQQYDESGQVIPQYDESHQPEYDENGQPIYQYDPNSQYYQDGQEYEQQYDENGQPIQLEAQVQEEQTSNANYQDDAAIVGNVIENISETATEKREDVKQNEPEKQLNVMDILDTDTESTKQETKVSNDSDFDFSNN